MREARIQQALAPVYPYVPKIVAPATTRLSWAATSSWMASAG
jgi:hypothetical protein